MSFNGKITLLKRWISIVLGKNRVTVEQGIGKFYSKNGIEGYYNDLTGKVSDKTILDSRGIPVNMIEGSKLVYFPISIFQYALGLWDLLIKTNKVEYSGHFIVITDWIVEHQQENGSWNCFAPIGYKKLTVSSMGQGEAISVLLRAFKLTGEIKYADAAEKAINFMMLPVESGGTLRIEEDDYIFEEYADIEGVKKSVLNGWIFSLFGVYDYIKYKNDKNIEDVFRKSINSLKSNLEEYDIGYWSYYDKTKRIASPAYHELHIILLKTIADITEDNYFLDVAKRWESYSNNKGKMICAIVRKAVQKLQESPEGIIIK